MNNPTIINVAVLVAATAVSALSAQTPADSTSAVSSPGATQGAAAIILTPPAPDTPRINGPKVFGVRTGSAFLYTVPATGSRPMSFSTEGLPASLKIDPDNGRITGVIDSKNCDLPVTLKVKNRLGSAEKAFHIIVGDTIALTPPMGWNSWNCWGGEVSQDKVLSSARAMAAKGLREHGWSYINIDDGWQGERGGEFNAIQPNSKFPDMKALADEIHSLGLKFGVYSTPWRGTYEGHIGTSSDNEDGTYEWIKAGDHNPFYRIGKDEKTWGAKRRSNYSFGQFSFAEKDSLQWAKWGVDYLKYDWKPNDVPHTQTMAAALRKSGRDVVFSLSNSAPYPLAADWARLANAWRTTGDITDTWPSMSGIGFQQDRWITYAGPGHWNDPDMLVVGQVGWGKPHPTKLTSDEQYTHISLWSLLSAPLLIGCDMASMDDFTVSVLSNDEVLEIDQDSLGKQAKQISSEGDKVVYAKSLEDGSTAVGLFNRGTAEAMVNVSWDALPAPQQDELRVRDLWRQKDLGSFPKNFETKVAPHGVVLIKVSAAK